MTLLSQVLNYQIISPADGSRLRGTIRTLCTTNPANVNTESELVLLQNGQKVQNLIHWKDPSVQGALLSFFDTREFADGEYSLKLTVTNVQGDASSAESFFTIDNTAPTIKRPVRINHLLFGNEVLPRSASVGIYGAFDEPVEPLEARWLNENGNVVGTLSPEMIDLKNGEMHSLLHLPSGNHFELTFQIRVNDDAGNTSKWSSSNPIRLTNHPPSPFLYPADNILLNDNEADHIFMEGLLWDTYNTFGEVDWRPVSGPSDWSRISHVFPTWHGYRWLLEERLNELPSSEIEVRARDRFGNVFGPVRSMISRTTISNASSEIPLVELSMPGKVLYQNQTTVLVKGTVINPQGADDLDWSLDVSLEGSNDWFSLVSGQPAAVRQSTLTTWKLPSLDGLYQLRLKASNTSGEVETTRSVFLSAARWPDRDEDGLSDMDEFHYFGVLDYGMNDDPDGDGLSNWKEILLGYNPSDEHSNLKPIELLSDGTIQLKWINENAVGYEVFRREMANRERWKKWADLDAAYAPVQTYVVEQNNTNLTSFFLVRKIKDPLAHLQILDLGDGVLLHLAKIPQGSFTMGSLTGDPDGSDDEEPSTEVFIPDFFYMGKHEVTQAQWMAVMGTNPSYRKGADLPVESITWEEAMKFCRQLTEREQSSGRLPAGFKFELPTEAQWEYACRAGSRTRFHYGNDKDYEDLGRYAWYDLNGRGRTHRVGQKTPNAWGLFDMYGNVWEWCLDYYASSYLGESVTHPQGPGSGSGKVCRGGSWHSVPWFCRSANRNQNEPRNASFNVGFRVVLQAAL